MDGRLIRCCVSMVVALITLLGLTVTVAVAQTAELRGVAIDSSGAVLPGVSVSVRGELTGIERLAVTDAEGAFRLPALQVGPYVIVMELAGFDTNKRQVVLTVGQVATIRVEMTVGALQESVQVVGSAGVVAIETSKSDLSAVVTQDQLLELPVLNRGFVGLAQLLPGAGPSRTADGRFGISTSLGGSGVRTNYTMLIDGSGMDNPIYGFALVNVSQDAVQEFRVLRNQFDSEYSRAGTAVVNVVTRSGTNDLRGRGSYFGRDDRLNAKNAFARTKPPFDLTRLSGTIGGPLVRNKAFYFGAVEYNRQNTVDIIAMPASNPFASTYNGVYSAGRRSKLLQSKIDYAPSQNHSVNARFLYDNTDVFDDYVQSTNEFLDVADWAGMWNWTLSGSAVNTVTVQYLSQNTGRFNPTSDPQVIRPSFTSGLSPNFPQYFPRKRYSLNDTFFLTKSRHTMKFGVRMSYEDLDYDNSYYSQGVWRFNTDRPFSVDDRATWPLSFTLGSERTIKNYRNTEWGFFIQDDISLGRVTLNLGLRYDFDTNLRSNDLVAEYASDPQFAGIENLVKVSDRGNDLNNLHPRIGVAWDVAGNGRTVVRGGFGLYTIRNRPWPNIRGAAISKQYSTEINDPELLKNYPDPVATLGGRTVEDYVRSRGGRQVDIVGHDYNLPFVRSMTLGVAKMLPGDTSLEIDLVRQQQRDLIAGVDVNLPERGPLSQNPRPYPQFSRVSVTSSLTSSDYDALQAQLRRRFHGSTWQISYTYSKTLVDGLNDNATLAVDPWHTFNDNDRGLDENHRPQQLSVSIVTPLPWQLQLATIGSLRSGTPWNIVAGVDLDGDGQSNERPAGLPQNAGGTRSQANLDIINAFRQSRNLAPITMDRLGLTSSDKVLDLRLTKQFNVKGSTRLEVFVEGYNVFNTVNYENPSGSISSGSFAVRTAARDARQMQWGGRIQF